MAEKLQSNTGHYDEQHDGADIDRPYSAGQRGPECAEPTGDSCFVCRRVRGRWHVMHPPPSEPQMQTVRSVAYKLVKRAVDSVRPQHINNHDPFVRWLTVITPGFLHYGNPHLFDYAIERLPSTAPMVEIGSYCGLSTNVITYYKAKHGRTNQLITCDRWIITPAQVQSVESLNISPGRFNTYVKDTFRRSVKMFSGNDLPHSMEMYSDEFFTKWASGAQVTDVFGRQASLGGPISFAYIDGDHSYEYAMRDFENCDKFLERGGFILFDDSADGADFGSCRAAREAAASNHYELVAKNPNYLIRKL